MLKIMQKYFHQKYFTCYSSKLTLKYLSNKSTNMSPKAHTYEMKIIKRCSMLLQLKVQGYHFHFRKSQIMPFASIFLYLLFFPV